MENREVIRGIEYPRSGVQFKANGLVNDPYWVAVTMDLEPRKPVLRPELVEAAFQAEGERRVGLDILGESF